MSRLAPSRRRALRIVFGVIAFGFALGRLSFVPVPWPDGSAFSLPGLDLIHWPPAWKMTSIQAFVPSYGHVNFQTMPGLSIVLGLAARLGLYSLVGATLATKLVSFAALGAFAIILAELGGGWAGALLAVAALFDPIDIWGTSVVRTEIWVGLAWLLILLTLVRNATPTPRALWMISFALGSAALFHFNAIIWVPGLAAALCYWGVRGGDDRSNALARWIGVAWRTVAVLSPWLLFVLFHLPEFKEQMALQFSRLSGEVRSPIHNLYTLFHGLWPTLGSPVTWPKFLNVGKALFWLTSLALLGHTGYAIVRGDQRVRAPLSAAALGFIGAIFIAINKPEPWFTTLAHLALWSWAGVALAVTPRTAKWLKPAVALNAALSVAVTAVIWSHVPRIFNWERYSTWVSCLVESIGPAPARVWQPYAPDALVDLVARDARYDVTRATDVPLTAERAREIAAGFDALVLSTFHSIPDGHYFGAPRAEDLKILDDGMRLPHAELAPAGIPPRICHEGPFWAAVFKKSAK